MKRTSFELLSRLVWKLPESKRHHYAEWTFGILQDSEPDTDREAFMKACRLPPVRGFQHWGYVIIAGLVATYVIYFMFIAKNRQSVPWCEQIRDVFG